MSMQNQLKMYFYTPVCIIVLILQLFDFSIWCFNLEVSLLYTQYTCKDLMIKQFLNKETFRNNASVVFGFKQVHNHLKTFFW